MSATSRAGRTMSDGAMAPAASQYVALRVCGAARSGRKRALDLGDHSNRHPGVVGCRLGLVVSNQRGNHADILAALEQMGREGMAKRMKRKRHAQPGGFRGFFEQPAELARSQRLKTIAPGKQPML